MLRLVVLLLLLANTAYFAWSQGLLAPIGLAPGVQTEPQRLGTQIKPEAIRLLTNNLATQLDNGGTAAAPLIGDATALVPIATECLQAGLFNEQQTATLRASLESTLPPGSWKAASSRRAGLSTWANTTLKSRWPKNVPSCASWVWVFVR